MHLIVKKNKHIGIVLYHKQNANLVHLPYANLITTVIYYIN